MLRDSLFHQTAAAVEEWKKKITTKGNIIFEAIMGSDDPAGLWMQIGADTDALARDPEPLLARLPLAYRGECRQFLYSEQLGRLD